MLNAIPAINTLGNSNPMTQQTALANVTQEIRTNNQEQLASQHVNQLYEVRLTRPVRGRPEEEKERSPSEQQRGGSPSSGNNRKKKVLQTRTSARESLLDILA
ncbi:MAG: hypothetical protein HQL77_11475 [Magnetococcales bacterium]|nr:hypothetical protein [Magnetococcales bacterium]